MVRSKTIIATPPGVTIKEQLDDVGMTQKEFAARMDMSEKHISRLINGEVQLTPEVSVRLETVLGIPASFWNQLEAIYREKLVRIAEENSIESDKKILRLFPYTEMAKSKWVPETDDTAERIINLRKFFGVVGLSLLENPQITRIACKHPSLTEKNDLSLLAWVQAARILARDVFSDPFSTVKLQAVLPQLKSIARQNSENRITLLQQVLSTCGVTIVFVPRLKGTFLTGATFLDGKRIIIGMVDESAETDQFQFSLFHEIGHIILGHLTREGGAGAEDEIAADKWAEKELQTNDKQDYLSNLEAFVKRETCRVSESHDQ